MEYNEMLNIVRRQGREPEAHEVACRVVAAQRGEGHRLWTSAALAAAAVASIVVPLAVRPAVASTPVDEGVAAVHRQVLPEVHRASGSDVAMRWLNKKSLNTLRYENNVLS